MTEQLFLKILNMSISASYLVIVVVLLRFLLKKAPKWVSVLLWGLVAVRLICPFTLESTLSLIPSAQTVSPQIMMDPTPAINSGIDAVNNAVNPIITEAFTPDPADSANPLQIWIGIASVIWLAGMLFMTLYTLISYWKLRHRVRTAVRLKGNIYQSELIATPFVLGLVRPKIYLPSHMDDLDKFHVIAHERTHIRRKDHWWKPLGFLLLSIHWFNPLMWLAYVLLCRDIEMACDENVVSGMKPHHRANYSQALLNCSIHRRQIAACPLAFGEVGVKTRVVNILNYKRPSFWVILVAVILCIAVAVCFLTDPAADVPFIGMYSPISEAYISSFQGSVTKERMLSADQREELACHLRDIQNIVETDHYPDIVSHQYLVFLTEEYGNASVYALSDQKGVLLLRYRKTNYQIHDAAFASYFDTLFDSAHITAEAPSYTAPDTFPDEDTPYRITSTIPIGKFSAQADYLTPGDIIGYGFFPDESEDLANILRSLTAENFVPATPMTPHSRFTLFWSGGRVILLTDGKQIHFGENASWAIEHDTLKDFLSQYRQDDNSYETADKAPLDQLPRYYNLEAATIDKVVIMVDGDIRENQSEWDTFIAAVNSGTAASVRYMQYYNSADYTSSHWDIFDLEFDGSRYLLHGLADGKVYEKQYIYLQHFEELNTADSADYDAYNRYVLTNSLYDSWEAVRGITVDGSVTSNASPQLVYSDIIYYPDHPDIPTVLVRATLELDGTVLKSITDAKQLNTLNSLFAGAELTYEPKTYNLLPILTFTGEDGGTVTVELDLEHDLCRIDGKYYDYGPGYNTVGGINALPDLWAILDMDNWE